MFFEDRAKTYRKRQSFYDAGCRDIFSFDDTVLGLALLARTNLDKLRTAAGRLQSVKAEYTLPAYQLCDRRAPADITCTDAAFCRGNFRSTWIFCLGGYEPVAETLRASTNRRS